MQASSNSVILRNARLPSRVTEAPGLSMDRDGFYRADIVIRAGVIAAITCVGLPISDDLPEIDLRDGQVWPLFVDLHTHLDKGHIWSRAENPDGTHSAAARLVAVDRKANWSMEDVSARFDFALRCALFHGTGAIRTHLDSYEPQQAEISFSVFANQASHWKDRILLQPVVMSRLDGYEGAAGERLAGLAADNGGLLGGILKVGQSASGRDPELIRRGLSRLLHLASDYRLDIDLHVDETGDLSSLQLLQVAEATLKHRFDGRVTCAHCCNLSVQDEETANHIIARVRDAGIAIVTLPMVNAYLQGRVQGRTPTWRGLTRIRELKTSGVTVVAASDNTRDPFHAFGDLDGMEVFRELIRLAHLDNESEEWISAVTTLPADVMGFGDRGRIAAGLSADIVLFSGRSMSEILARPQSDRRVMRMGVIQNASLPDYRELDHLFLSRKEEGCGRWSA
jgi:cytosine deaminase